MPTINKRSASSTISISEEYETAPVKQSRLSFAPIRRGSRRNPKPPNVREWVAARLADGWSLVAVDAHGLNYGWWEHGDDEQTDFLLHLSDEQTRARDAALAGSNVTVQAVPGAGKTHFLLHLARYMRRRGLRPVGVTYSSELKKEWRQRDTGGVVHSFHSLAMECFNQPVRNDDQLCDMLASNATPRFQYDVILLDEAQDMCPLYLALLQRLTSTLNTAPQLVVVGQAQQCIYSFWKDDKKASELYLTNAEEMLETISNDREWAHHHFSVSYRLTMPMATFVNHFFDLPAESQITGVRMGTEPVDYYIVKPFDHEEIAKKMAEYILKYDKTAIITPTNTANYSATSKAPYRTISNILTSNMNIALQQCNDSGTCTHEFTCCSCKGQEVDLCILFGADAFSDFVSMSQRFVSMTRAREKLVIFQSCDQLAWNGMEPRQLKTLPHLRVHEWSKFRLRPKGIQPASICVTDLFRGGTSKKLRSVLRRTATQTHRAGDPLRIDGHTFAVGEELFTPDVSLLYGTAIPVLAEARRNGASAMYHGCPLAYRRIFEPIVVDATDPLLGLASAINLTEDEAADLEAARQLIVDARSTNNEELLNDYHLNKHTATRSSHVADAIRNMDIPFSVAARIISVDSYKSMFPPAHVARLREQVPPELCASWTPQQAMQAACAQMSFDGFHYRFNQITEYDSWVNEATIQKATARILDVIAATPTLGSIQWEHELRYILSEPVDVGRPLPVDSLRGRIDYIDTASRTVYEFKHTSTLSTVEQAQLLTYMHLYNLEVNPAYKEDDVTPLQKVRGVLFNARTTESWELAIQCSHKESCAFLHSVILDLAQR